MPSTKVASAGLSGSGVLVWSVQTTNFTAVAGNGYYVNTTSAAVTVTLPAGTPTAGQQIALVDYAGTFDTNNLIISPNGNKIEGSLLNQLLTGEREGVTLTFTDATQGWLCNSGINEGTDALEPNTYSVDFLVVAGGGGSGGHCGGGGGAGGYRTSTQSVPVGTVITVTVGDGGAGGGYPSSTQGVNGSDSSISGSGLSTITSAGGGGGDGFAGGGNSGGSGGGSGFSGTAGSGNTPSTSPSQGNNGGSWGGPNLSGAGGGGAGAVGGNAVTTTGGNGGNGTASSITGSSVTRAGGGAGTGDVTGGTGGTGGGGAGSNSVGTGTAGTANTGGGAGGSRDNPGASGGKGVVILSLPTAKYSSTSTGSPTVITGVGGTHTVITFEESGSYTA